jgi:hypothetical protein
MSGYNDDPFVKLRKKIFGEDKKKAVEDGGEVTMKKGGKVKKYDEGGDVVIEDESERGIVTPEQKQAGRDTNSFGDAFKEARAAGDKTFMWKGKSYTTEVASEKPKSTVKQQEKFSSSKAIGVSPTKKAPGFMAKSMGFKKGGSVSSASKRADGAAIRGKTRGKIC